MNPSEQLGMTASQQLAPYAAIGILMLVIGGMAAVMLILAHVLGPKRHGPVKDMAYESGMVAIGDARQRFNVRFYLVAMLFLLFDVEIVFLWPWAPVFHQAATAGKELAIAPGVMVGKTFLLMEVVMFLAILLVGYVYAWRKGVFQWD